MACEDSSSWMQQFPRVGPIHVGFRDTVPGISFTPNSSSTSRRTHRVNLKIISSFLTSASVLRAQVRSEEHGDKRASWGQAGEKVADDARYREGWDSPRLVDHQTYFDRYMFLFVDTVMKDSEVSGLLVLFGV